MKFKRLFSVLLVAVLLLSVCPVGALAAETSGTCGDNATWQIESDGTLRISGSGAMYDYLYKNSPWYTYQSSGTTPYITSIEIEYGITTVGDWAFRHLSYLTSVTLPGSIVSIGDSAFEACSRLTSIELPDSLETIEYYAFVNCSKLSNVTIPARVTSVHSRAFQQTDALKEISVDSGNEYYCSVDGVLYSKDMTTLVKYPEGKTDSTLTIPEGVTTILNSALYLSDNLKTINLPKSISTIEDYAFGQCTGLTSVNYSGTASEFSKVNVGSGNTYLTNATWTCAEPDYSFTISNATTTKGDTATVSLTLDGDVTVLAGTIDVSAKDGNENVLSVSSIAAANIAETEVDSEGNRILVVSEGTIAAGTKIADITFATNDDTVAGEYTVTVVTELYTGDTAANAQENQDELLEFTVNNGTITIIEKPVTVIWANYDGTVLETDENVPYGSTPEYNGDTPARPSTQQYSYTFNGWEPEIDAVTGDTTYTATFTETVRSYTLSFYEEDGTTLITTLTAPYGTEVADITGIPDVPAKEANAQYTYTPKDWNVQKVTGDATYVASYTETVNTYTIKWVDEDGTTELDEQTLEYGATPEFRGETPTKATDVGYTYAFDKWTPEVVDVSGEATYTASYTATARTYDVKVVSNAAIDGASGLSIIIKNGDTQILPEGGRYKLTYGVEYTFTAEAIGYNAINGTISVNGGEGTWNFEDGDNAGLILPDMEKRMGDLNNDGTITVTDAQALYNYILGRITVDENGIAYNDSGAIIFIEYVADINGNGKVGADDILPMLRLINANS